MPHRPPPPPPDVVGERHLRCPACGKGFTAGGPYGDDAIDARVLARLRTDAEAHVAACVSARRGIRAPGAREIRVLTCPEATAGWVRLIVDGRVFRNFHSLSDEDWADLLRALGHKVVTEDVVLCGREYASGKTIGRLVDDPAWTRYFGPNVDD